MSGENRTVWENEIRLLLEFEPYDRYGNKYTISKKNIFVSPGVFTREKDINIWPYPPQT